MKKLLTLAVLGAIAFAAYRALNIETYARDD